MSKKVTLSGKKFSTGDIKWGKVVGCGLKNFYFYPSNSDCIMITFIGDFVCKPDAKGRIVLPARFKRIMQTAGQDCLVVRKHPLESCLQLIPYEEWLKEMAVLEKKLNGFNPKQQRLKRALFRSSAEVNLDGNGRFLIPKRLMDLVGVDGEVILIGVGDRLELWDRVRMEESEPDEEELRMLTAEFLGNTPGDLEE